MPLRTAKQLAKVTRPEPGSWLDRTVHRGFEMSAERRRLLNLDDDILYLEMVDVIREMVDGRIKDYEESAEEAQSGFDNAYIAIAISALLDEASALSLTRDNQTVAVSWRDLSKYAIVLLSAAEAIADSDDVMFWWPQDSATQLVETMAEAPASGEMVWTGRAVIERAADAMLTCSLAIDAGPEHMVHLQIASDEIRALLNAK